MAKYGNSAGRNRGKKYRKLRGFEQATPESEALARAFMNWYGANIIRLRAKIKAYDDEVATDTALQIYDNIALKNYEIKDYEGYFLRAYYTNRLATLKNQTHKVYLDSNVEDMRNPNGAKTLRVLVGDNLAAPDFNYEKYEATVDQINGEILDYVRDNYDPVAASLFEIYIGLQPDISYKRLAVLLGFPVTKIWSNIGRIRKDVVRRFTDRKDNLLSMV